MKYFILIATALITITSCTQKNEVLAESTTEMDSLVKVASEREQSINDFIDGFNEIERNLDLVAVKQQFITLNSDKKGGDLKLNQKNRIIEEITAINTLMLENNKKIEELKRKLSKDKKKSSQLEETIITLNNQMTQKNIELGILHERLSSLDVQVAQLQSSVDTLLIQNLVKSDIINKNTETLHTAYYVVGKSKELRDANLIDRRGGLLGIGTTSELSPDFDKEKFVCIDYTHITTITINSNGVKIITSHPTDSYRLDKDSENDKVVKNMVITNPEKFWSASKYLVIVKG